MLDLHHWCCAPAAEPRVPVEVQQLEPEVADARGEDSEVFELELIEVELERVVRETAVSPGYPRAMLEASTSLQCEAASSRIARFDFAPAEGEKPCCRSCEASGRSWCAETFIWQIESE